MGMPVRLSFDSTRATPRRRQPFPAAGVDALPYAVELADRSQEVLD
jgi:hypothetical protein